MEGLIYSTVLEKFPRFFDALTLRNAKKILLKEGKNNILGERTISFEDDKICTKTKFEKNSVQYVVIIDMKQSCNAAYLYKRLLALLILLLVYTVSCVILYHFLIIPIF